ncbi:hypothetical protein GDO81_011313 [Engystomops pustulosus]|uniref:Uncharacterized protein n=1 Tax=Engystomops pustulosus TaxID=76066 RepID=A0AAV7BDL6_ENGPU|nr:hypothetical protein GDO81_011313 [Engystomops pustulosus]
MPIYCGLKEGGGSKDGCSEDKSCALPWLRHPGQTSMEGIEDTPGEVVDDTGKTERIKTVENRGLMTRMGATKKKP